MVLFVGRGLDPAVPRGHFVGKSAGAYPMGQTQPPPYGVVGQNDEGVIMEIMMFQLGAYQTNCYVLCDETQKICAVIDPGDSGEALGTKIVELGYDVKAILLTHGHHDHTGGVEALHQAFPAAPIYLHPKDGREATTAMRSIVPTLSVDTVD